MTKFQISFKNVPKPVIETLLPKVTTQLLKNGWVLTENVRCMSLVHQDVSVLFGELANRSDWNIGVYYPDRFKVYHLINDWDKWSLITAFPTTVTVPLNEKYSAEIQPNGDVKVGCQTFDYATVQELAEKAKKHLDSQK